MDPGMIRRKQRPCRTRCGGERSMAARVWESTLCFYKHTGELERLVWAVPLAAVRSGSATSPVLHFFQHLRQAGSLFSWRMDHQFLDTRIDIHFVLPFARLYVQLFNKDSKQRPCEIFAY